MDRTKILIADDHALVREGVIALLKYYDDFEIVGEASSGSEAVEKAQGLRPDLILMDIAMPGFGGLEATLEIKKTCPDIKVLILSQYDDKEYVNRLLKAGVSGYILKHAIGTDLVAAIRAVAKGGLSLSVRCNRCRGRLFGEDGDPGDALRKAYGQGETGAEAPCGRPQPQGDSGNAEYKPEDGHSPPDPHCRKDRDAYEGRNCKVCDKRRDNQSLIKKRPDSFCYRRSWTLRRRLL